MKPSSTKKNVLIIGDSLSIGYTPAVAANLSDIALVQHAPWDSRDGGAEESAYMDQCLDAGFRPGMGHIVPDRLFWAEADEAEGEEDSDGLPATADDFSLPRHETKH